MSYLLIEHKIEDYDKWKPIYDEHETTRRRAGLKEAYLFRDSKDPNLIVALFEASDPAKTREFIASEDLKQVMKRAGVVGTPVFYVLEKAALRKAA